MPTVYDIVTERIITALESGTVPWRKPWKDTDGPHNGASRKAYRGINHALLSCSDYPTGDWYTFPQAQKLGAYVRKGERGTPVVFWQFDNGSRPDGSIVPSKDRRAPFCRYYTVFNRAQIEGLPPLPERSTRIVTPIESAQRIVQGYKSSPVVSHGGNRAFYRPSTDAVQMPTQENFVSDDAYYATLFHELAHSTGHASRLNRDGITSVAHFGDAVYSKEELVAELGAAMLCQKAGIDNLVDQSAAYIQGWITALRGDSKLVMKSASAAQKAADWILGDISEND